MTTAIAGLTFERRIGIGAMGEVWRARARDGTTVAVKVARDEIRDPRLHALITAEARVLAKLDHPRISWLYDHGRMPTGTPFPVDCPYLVLEHCGGGTLAQRKVDDWATTRPIVVGLLRALAHAHAHGIVHRDLKPANVLWSGPSDVRSGMKLADFGVAWSMGSGQRAQRAGTPVYMAPEQGRISDVPVGPYTDLFALGVVVWELVTGQLPWDGPSPSAILVATLEGLPAFVPRFPVPAGLDEWLERLMEAEPRRRTGHAAEALQALSAIDPEVEPTGTGWEDPPRVGPRLRLQGAGLGLLALRTPELAGRKTERAALWATLEAARAERSVRIAIVRGTSGIGKTRLCRWLAERAAELGRADPVVVACRPDATLPRLLGALFRIEDSGAERPAAIRVALEAHGASVADRIEALLADATGPWGGVPVVLEVLRDEATFRPRLVVLDDAQQCVNAVRLAAALAAERVAAPLLVVVAVEEEALARDPALEALVNALERRPGVVVMPLGPLSAPDQEELLRTLVGLDPEAHAETLARAGGHPGYTVDQVTSWAREGVLAPGRRGFRWVSAGAPAGSWSSLWAERLELWLQPMDPADHVLLERAAVVGRAVDTALWEAACDDPEGTRPIDSVRVDRSAARRRAILVDRSITAGLAQETDEGFAFTHPAIVDLLLERAREAGRLREHHRACANQLRRSPGPGSALRLGRHLAAAELWEEAVPCLLSGIVLAWRSQDRRPLLSDLGTAWTCADRAGWADDDPRRWELHHLRALLLLTAGRTDEAGEAGRRAWELAVETGVRAHVAFTLLRRIDILCAANRLEELANLVPAFLEVEDAAALPHWPAIVRIRYAKRMKQLGLDEGARRWFAQAEEILLAASESGSCAVSGALLELYSARGDMTHVGAERDLERILELGPAMERAAADRGETDLRVLAASIQTEAARALGRNAEAIEAGERALRVSAQIGDERFQMFMQTQLATVDMTEGRHPQALCRLDAALHASDRVQNAWLIGVICLARAECHIRTGDYGRFDRELPELDTHLPRVVGADPSLLAQLELLVSLLHGQGERTRAASLEGILDRTRRTARP